VTALTPAVNAYANGLQVKFRAAHANTGQATLNAGAGVVPLLRDDGTVLQAGDVPANAIVGATYDAAAAAFLLNSIVASQFDTIMQSGAPLYSVDTGTANVYRAAYAPTVTALTDGMKLRFRAKTANTAASTFAPDGIPAAPIWGGDHAALAGGEIVVNGEIEVQWNTVLNGGNGAWVLCENTGGYQRGVTPPQFDNSGRLAPTAFVQRALGNFNLSSGTGSGINAAATALTNADLGGFHYFNGTANQTATLPSEMGLQPGAAIIFQRSGSQYGLVISSYSANAIIDTTVGLASSITLNPGEFVVLVWSGSYWQSFGTYTQRVGQAFASSLNTTGYQKLPSGLIVQWVNGSSDSLGNMTVAFPIAFPTAVLGGIANEGAPGGWGSTGATIWAFDIAASTVTTGVARVRAITGTNGPVISSGISGRILVWGK
uniref:gp53-like domain-containing protein n=1 Tax=Burkholderia pyrrocinia TaxID=60550 RepID=UPI00158A0C8B